MTLSESLYAILSDRDRLAAMFYQHYLGNVPAVRRHFQGTLLHGQAVLLTMALMVVEQNFIHHYPATAMYLRYLGSKHAQRGIPIEEFPGFREALLATLAEFHGSAWSEELAFEWRSALDAAIALMQEGYHTHYTV